MKDDTRLRDGLLARASPKGSAAAEMETGVYAALDLGTNNCRLLIACPAGDGFRVVDSFSRIIRLGEGIAATGSISDAAIERAIDALSICSDKIRYRRARRLRLIATEACRAAANADSFRDRVAAETGIVMIVYIDHAFIRRLKAGKMNDLNDIIHAHTEGTVLRVRPKLMTVSTMLIGLIPLLWATGSGADVMKRIAAPMVGGLLSSAFLTLEMIPVIYTYWRYSQLKRAKRLGRPLAEVAGIELS